MGMKREIVMSNYANRLLYVLSSLLILVNCQNGQLIDTSGTTKCTKPVPITIPECQNTFYNFTGMPNFADHDSQLEAHRELRTFGRLIAYKCSPRLSFFLCSVYTPMCDVNTHHLIGPCRPLCEQVRSKCAPVLRVFNIDWPASLNCSRFPIQNVVGGSMCMEGPNNNENNPSNLKMHPILDRLHKLPNFKANVHEDAFQPTEEFLHDWIQKFFSPNLENDNTIQTSSSIALMSQSLRHCSFMNKPTFYIYINRTGRCAPVCQSDILFSQESKYLATIWTLVLTIICMILTVITLVGYSIDTTQFRLAEKPIIYITLCQLLQAVGFVLSLSLGRNAITCGKDLDSGRFIRLQEGLDNSLCAFTFLLQYFSAIAGVFWWALLTLHWTVQHAQCLFCSTICNHPIPLQGHRNSQKFEKWWTNIGDIFASVFGRTRWTGRHEITASQNNHVPPPIVIMSNPDSSPADQCRMSTEVSTQPTASYFVQNGKVVPSYSVRSNRISDNSRRYSLTNKAGSDKISVCLSREHILVWLTASLLTVGVLVSRQVDADELIPICGVGRQNTRAMGAFVIGPEITLTFIGFMALLIGSCLVTLRKRKTCAQQRPREVITVMHHSKDDSKTATSKTLIIDDDSTIPDKNGIRVSLTPSSSYSNKYSAISDRTHTASDFLTTRLGLFCFLYFLPTICICSCDLYEYHNRENWLRTNRQQSVGELLHTLSPNLWKSEEVIGPNPEIFLLRLFMSIAPTFACSLWVWSVKGCGIWRRGLTRFAKRIGKLKANNKYAQKSLYNAYFDFPVNRVNQTSTLRDSVGSLSKARRDIAHPYAIYQQHSIDTRWNPVIVSTSAAWIAPLDPPLIDLCLVQSTTGITETQHSNATTPGYYSQAKLGSGIEPSSSDTFSEESPIPPPLPASTRPQLLVRGDPCIGSSVTHVSMLPAPSNTLTHASKNFRAFHIE